MVERHYFMDFDLGDFWDEGEYSNSLLSAYPTDDIVQKVQNELGYKLPAAYVELMRIRNGGGINRRYFPLDFNRYGRDEPDEIEVRTFYSIGWQNDWSLCNESGSRYMIEEWGYPNVGICLMDTPSSGHEIIMLDYSKCGPEGEPSVIYIDQEDDYYTLKLAPNFFEFIGKLTGTSQCMYE